MWRKLAGKKDWEVKPIILDGDWTFMTRNSVDFRESSSNPGRGDNMLRRYPRQHK